MIHHILFVMLAEKFATGGTVGQNDLGICSEAIRNSTHVGIEL
jgi:hypothetical protein